MSESDILDLNRGFVRSDGYIRLGSSWGEFDTRGRGDGRLTSFIGSLVVIFRSRLYPRGLSNSKRSIVSIKGRQGEEQETSTPFLLGSVSRLQPFSLRVELRAVWEDLS